MPTNAQGKDPKKEILVADDELGFHTLFRYLLEPKGFHVVSAHDGLEALELAQQRDFAVIFLDIHMPKMTGQEVLRQIKAIKPHQRIVMLSSGANSADVKDETDKLGADACFQKPFDIKDILMIISTL